MPEDILLRKPAKKKTANKKPKTSPGITIVCRAKVLRIPAAGDDEPITAPWERLCDGNDDDDDESDHDAGLVQLRRKLHAADEVPTTVVLRDLDRWGAGWASVVLRMLYGSRESISIEVGDGKATDLLTAVLAHVTAEQSPEQRSRVRSLALTVAGLYPRDCRDDALEAIRRRCRTIKVAVPSLKSLREACDEHGEQRDDGGPAMRLAGQYLQSLLGDARYATPGGAIVDNPSRDHDVPGLLRHRQRWLTYDEANERYREMPDNELYDAVMRYAQRMAGSSTLGDRDVGKHLVEDTIANLRGMVPTIPSNMELAVWLGPPVADATSAATDPHPDELRDWATDEEETDSSADEDQGDLKQVDRDELNHDEEDSESDDSEEQGVSAAQARFTFQPWEGEIRTAVTIAVQNGRLYLPPDCGKPQLLPASRRYVGGPPLGFEFIAGAKCPQWRAFLDKALPRESEHDHRQEILQEFMGWTITGARGDRYEKALLLHGKPGTGKSTVIAVMMALLGEENCAHLRLDELGSRFGPARLEAKLANLSADTQEVDRIDEGILKQLISMERQKSERKFFDAVDTTFTAKLVFAANDLPPFRDPGTWDRLILLPMQSRIRATEADIKHFAQKHLFPELAGIANWLLIGLRRLLRQGRFTKCEVSDRSLAEHRIMSDPIRAWIKDRCELVETGVACGVNLYSDYREWFAKSGGGEKSRAWISERRFLSRLKEIVGEPTRQRKRGERDRQRYRLRLRSSSLA